MGKKEKEIKREAKERSPPPKINMIINKELAGGAYTGGKGGGGGLLYEFFTRGPICKAKSNNGWLNK